MKTRILEKLEQLEQENNIEIIYAVESGSRAWGFASADSDFDVRFIYIPRKSWYFSLTPQPDTLQFMDAEKVLDFSGWEIKKTLTLLSKSNMALYEWLRSPLIYREKPIVSELRALADTIWERKSLQYSYVALARNNYRIYIESRTEVRLKKYLYVLRTLAACIWLETEETLPPIVTRELAPVLKTANPAAGKFLDEILAAKAEKSELGTAASNKPVNDWIADRLAYYDRYLAAQPDTKPVLAPLETFLYKTVLDR